MSYFPFFVELEGRRGLIVGGGTVAARKAEKLLPYGPELTVVAPEISEETAGLGVELLRRSFEEKDLDGVHFVIAAATPEVDRRVAALCKERGLPVNVVDAPSHCTFLFPALIQRGKLSVGISTAGASPTAAVYLKEQMEAALPPDLEELLDYLEALRPKLKATIPQQGRRAGVFRALFRACMAAGRPLEEEETALIVKSCMEEWA